MAEIVGKVILDACDKLKKCKHPELKEYTVDFEFGGNEYRAFIRGKKSRTPARLEQKDEK